MFEDVWRSSAKPVQISKREILPKCKGGITLLHTCRARTGHTHTPSRTSHPFSSYSSDLLQPGQKNWRNWSCLSAEMLSPLVWTFQVETKNYPPLHGRRILSAQIGLSRIWLLTSDWAATSLESWTFRKWKQAGTCVTTQGWKAAGKPSSQLRWFGCTLPDSNCLHGGQKVQVTVWKHLKTKVVSPGVT